MSIQHKSRIRSVADYSNIISFKGACCYPNSSNPKEEYYNTCISGNGIWYPLEEGSDITNFACPDIGATGCCCACKFVGSSVSWDWGEGGDPEEDPGFRGASGFFENWGDDAGCKNNETTDTDLNYPCYQGGLKDNITFCECSDAGGVWAEGIPCSHYTGATCDGDVIDGVCNGMMYVRHSAQSLCTRAFSQDDVRWPGSCCSEGAGDGGINVCDDACSPKHCAEIRDGHGVINAEFNSSKWCSPAPTTDPFPYEESNCEESLLVGGDGDGNHESNTVYEIDPRTNVYIPKYSTPIPPSERKYRSNYNKKSACVYVQKNDSGSTEMICSSMTKSQCDTKKGMFVGFNEENQPFSCDSDASTEIKTYLQNKQKIDSATLSTWSPGERRLNLGRFVGEMYLQDSNHGIGSVCYGNLKTGKSDIYYPVDNDNTKNSGKSFAVFIADNDFQYRSFNENGWAYDFNRNKELTKNSSSWDSEFNTSYNRHFDLIKKVDKSYNKNPYHNWQVPPIDVLSFIKWQTNNNPFIENTTTEDKYPNSKYKPMKSTNKDFYWSSTQYKSESGGIEMAYCQSFGIDSRVALSEIFKKRHVRLAMTIPIL